MSVYHDDFLDKEPKIMGTWPSQSEILMRQAFAFHKLSHFFVIVTEYWLTQVHICIIEYYSFIKTGVMDTQKDIAQLRAIIASLVYKS